MKASGMPTFQMNLGGELFYKMKVNSFLVKVLSLVLVLCFTACGGQNKNSTNSANTNSTPTPSPTPTQFMPDIEDIRDANHGKFARAVRDSEFLQQVDQGDTYWVKLALSKGANVNERDKGNRSGLIIAAKAGDIEMAKVLIGAGADVNLQDSYGSTALMHAVSRKNKEFIDLLLDNKANVNIPDSFGKTPLMQAAGTGANDIVEKLLSKGAKLTGKANNGWTLAQFAEGHDDTVKILKKAGMK